MLKIDCEFRKGILFVRLTGNLTCEDYYRNCNRLIELIEKIGINNIVLNIDEIRTIDIYGINYILGYYNYIKDKRGNFIICEKDNQISDRLLKNKIPCIENEIEAFGVL